MSNLEDSFGPWLKLVLPNSGSAERDERLGAIRKFAATVTKGDIFDLVLAFYSSAKQQATVERLRSAMRDVDTSFGPKDDAELAVLATGVLFEILQTSGNLAATAALAILCAEFGALAGNNHIIGLVTEARQFIRNEGTRIREESVELPSLRKALRLALSPEDEDGDAENTKDDEEEASDIEASLHRVVDALAEFAEKTNQSLASIEARRAEQSDALFWLLSGRREIGGPPLKGLNTDQAAIFVAVELAGLTRQIPGPASAFAILSSLVSQCKNSETNEVTLEACIQSIEPADGQKYLSKLAAVQPVISPISFALIKAEETGWMDGWQNAVKTQTRLDANRAYPVLRISEQLYLETLLSRALGES